MPFLYDPNDTDFEFTGFQDSWSFLPPSTDAESEHDLVRFRFRGDGPHTNPQPVQAATRRTRAGLVGASDASSVSPAIHHTSESLLGPLIPRPRLPSMLTLIGMNLPVESRTDASAVSTERLTSARYTGPNNFGSTQAESTDIARDRFRTSHPPSEAESLREQARETTSTLRQERLSRESQEQTARSRRQGVASSGLIGYISRLRSAEDAEPPSDHFTTSLPTSMEASLRNSLQFLAPTVLERVLARLEERMGQLQAEQMGETVNGGHSGSGND